LKASNRAMKAASSVKSQLMKGSRQFGRVGGQNLFLAAPLQDL
jgi:hypothetical protein